MLRTTPLPAGRGLFYIAVAATAWGTGGAVAAVLFTSSGLSALTVSFWRFLGGALALAVVYPWLRRPGSPSLYSRLRAAPVPLVVTGAGMAVYQTAYFAAVGSAGVTIATVVTLGSGPILVALGARVWMSERLGRRCVLVLGAALLGLILLVFSDSSAGPAAQQPSLGIGLALLSAAGYAGTTLLSRALGTDRAEASGIGPDPVGNALIGMIVGACCLLPPALTVGVLPSQGEPLTTVALLVYLGLVPSALAYGLFFAGLTAVTATTAAVVALVEPLAAAVIAVALLGERLTVQAVLGGVVLLGAVIALATTERRNGAGRQSWLRTAHRSAKAGGATVVRR